MDNERQSRKFESVYSKKVRAGKRRTYFFDVRRTKGEDYYLTLTESSRRMDGGYERHKIFLYKEDFNRFIESLEETINYIKTELMQALALCMIPSSYCIFSSIPTTRNVLLAQF